MPQGKGTYGSKVGRPPKKKYDKGGNVVRDKLQMLAEVGFRPNVDPFSSKNPEGIPTEMMEEVLDQKNEAEEGLPTTNAMDRSQTMPDTEQYNLGGKIKEEVRTRVQDVRHRVGEKAKAKKRKKEMGKAHQEFKKEYSKRRKKADKQTKKALKAKDPSSSTNILDITHDVQGSEIKMEKISKKRNTH